MTLVKPQLMLLDFNRESRHLGEHFARHPHLILERHRRGDRRGTVKVPTVLQVTKGQSQASEETAKGPHPSPVTNCTSHTGFHWELREAGLKAANTIPERSSNQNDWEKCKMETFLQTEQRLKITSLSVPSQLPSSILPISAPKTADRWKAHLLGPLPTGFQLCLTTGRYLQETGGQTEGKTVFISAPQSQPTTFSAPRHYSFASSFCTNSHSCSFTPTCGRPFPTRQVPSVVISLPCCPNPGQPSIGDLFIQLSSIIHFECVICFLLGI